MIAHFHHCIEQLDLAAQQFRRASSAYARFALILTDNVLELILHKFAEQELKGDEVWRILGKRKYSDAERAKVLGQHFDEKPKFLRKLGVLSDDQMTFIQICHRYRNELYHQGILHESVIFDIAWHYHEVVCDFLPRLQKGSYWWRMGEPVSTTVKTYCGEEGLSRDPEQRLHEVAKKLAKAKPDASRSFASALSEAAVARLDALDSDIEFLIADSPGTQTRSSVLFDVQAWPFLFSDVGKDTIQLRPGEEIPSLEYAFDLLRKHWKPPVSNDPVPKWRDRAVQLQNDVSVFKVLEKYQQLMDQMDYLEERVRDAAVALDQHIQQEIDRRRGK